ncbi:hypothetical protein [Parageobacillus galactosidasius]|jgi:hypothetical protein|uniref:Uncharacterized protein n=1 Tax=Parageobacillus galactosidasius TaxID=883812 RepID=A0A226QKP3_9BACL|nr:hypothetical protein [Parageobacillus galactosidasius]OXB93121.1 hypothetical protein B9L23_18640 [Parageobacillus galactosidasius]
MPIQAWERCLEYNDNRSLVTVEENGRGIKFINNKRKKVALYRVDGCILTEGIKCDFLFLINEDKRAFFIELKGSDLEKAVQQISKTIEQLQPYLREYVLEGRIITTRVRTPALKSTYIIRLQKILRKTGGTLNIKAKSDEVTI